MAYGALAGLRPVNGLYASFFPVLAYFFFTTSRHNSFGTFSLAALLFCNPINRITNLYYVPSHSNSSIGMSDDEYNFRLNVAVTLAFSVGILQVIMALLQFGFLVTYLSGPFISGFMCASAFHVVTSQLNSMFGLKLPRAYGPGNIFMKYYYLAKNIKQANIATIVVCATNILILHIFRIFINPPFRKRFKFPIPVELLVVILSTVLSHFIGFSQRWGVQVVGQIPFGRWFFYEIHSNTHTNHREFNFIQQFPQLEGTERTLVVQCTWCSNLPDHQVHLLILGFLHRWCQHLPTSPIS
uniref:STAS domain-containing protein n=1 Tax=Mesocestoides corti TaxID=53468 RepID=A0A5K3FUX0_MESCO